MIITQINVTPVAFRDPPLLNAAGVHEPWALRTIVEVVTDEGLTGLGETYGDLGHLDQGTGVRRGADRPRRARHEPDVRQDRRHRRRRGERPARPDRRRHQGEERRPGVLPVRGGLPGHPGQGGRRARGRPARRQGPRRRAVQRLPLLQVGRPPRAPSPTGSAPRSTPTGVVAQAALLIEEYGFTSIKLKGGVFPPEQEIAAIRALHEAFPGLPLRLDPNAAWTVETSIRVGRELDGVLEYLEDPTPGIDGMAEVAAAGADAAGHQHVRRHLRAPAPRHRRPRHRRAAARPPLLGRPASAPRTSPPSARPSAWGCPCTPTPTSASAWPP